MADLRVSQLTEEVSVTASDVSARTSALQYEVSVVPDADMLVSDLVYEVSVAIGEETPFIRGLLRRAYMQRIVQRRA